VTVLRAWRAWAGRHASTARDLGAIDAEVHAMRPSAAGREAARAMGTRLIKTWQQIRPDVDLSRLSGMTRRGWSLPTAFGIVTCASGIGARDAVSGVIYARLAATMSAAMRLMPLGQHEAHAMLAAVLARVPERVEPLLAAPALAPRSFAPAMDIAAMSQQYAQSRLFRS
jgi:urease accessory protein